MVLQCDIRTTFLSHMVPTGGHSESIFGILLAFSHCFNHVTTVVVLFWSAMTEPLVYPSEPLVELRYSRNTIHCTKCKKNAHASEKGRGNLRSVIAAVGTLFFSGGMGESSVIFSRFHIEWCLPARKRQSPVHEVQMFSLVWGGSFYISSTYHFFFGGMGGQ